MTTKQTKQIDKQKKWEDEFDNRYKFEEEFSGDDLCGLNILKADIKDFIRKLLIDYKHK
jgi:hypothetical protein